MEYEFNNKESDYPASLVSLLDRLRVEILAGGEGFPVVAYMPDDGPFSAWIGCLVMGFELRGWSDLGYEGGHCDEWFLKTTKVFH